MYHCNIVINELDSYRSGSGVMSSRSGGIEGSRVEEPDPRDLDTLLGELTLVNARAELYLRFLRRRVTVSCITFNSLQ